MGIVVPNQESATMLGEFSRTILKSIAEKKYEFVEIPENQILGILTLENVIERILNMDISDEKDLDRSLKTSDAHPRLNE